MAAFIRNENIFLAARVNYSEFVGNIKQKEHAGYMLFLNLIL